MLFTHRKSEKSKREKGEEKKEMREKGSKRGGGGSIKREKGREM